MRRVHKILKLTLIVAVGLFIFVPFSHGAVILDVSFSDGEIPDAGAVVKTAKGFGWNSLINHPKGYGPPKGLIFPVEQIFANSEGTLEFELTRNNGEQNTEALFSFVDQDFETIKVVQINWKGETPVLSIQGGGPATKLWHRDYSKPEYGSIKVLVERIPFDREIQDGETFKLAFTWGTSPKIFLNGTELETLTDSFGLPTLLERTDWVVIGTEPAKDGTIGYSHLRSPLSLIRVYDGTISSVIHNAFQQAGYSGKLVTGDTFKVTLKAETGGTATFDLVQPESVSKGLITPEKIRIAGHPMTEDPDNPGTYIGTHIVEYGEDVEDGQVVGHFTNAAGLDSEPVAATKTVTVDTRVYMDVNASNDLIPADEESKAGITIVAKNANDKPVRDHELLLTMSTTDEYTGILGGGTFEDMVGGEIDVDWGGETDSFGEVTAQYQSGFAAKTILVSAKDMVSGDVGVGYVRAYITGTVDVLVKRPQAMALSLAGSMEVSLSREWLTADGRSRSRITAVVKDQDGNPLEGHNIQFALLGNNGKIRAIKSWTDARGRASADYIAGTVIGEVQIEVRDMTGGHVALVSIQLRSDAPAEIALTAEPGEVFTDNAIGSVITAKVTDANGNPNFNTDVLFEVEAGGGTMSADSAVTDEKDGIASVNFLPGSEPGLSTIKATVMSRAATTDEVAAAEGAVFLYGLDDDPGRLEVVEWFAEPEDEVTEGQDLVNLEDRRGTVFTVKAPRDGTLATFVAEERDRVVYGQTLGYILPLEE